MRLQFREGFGMACSQCRSVPSKIGYRVRHGLIGEVILFPRFRGKLSCFARGVRRGESYPLRVALQYVRKSSSGTAIAEQALITDSESQDKYRADFECDGTLGWVRFNARWDTNEHKGIKLPATEGGNDGREVSCKVQKLTKQPQ